MFEDMECMFEGMGGGRLFEYLRRLFEYLTGCAASVFA
jgi:hypothetical protein